MDITVQIDALNEPELAMVEVADLIPPHHHEQAAWIGSRLDNPLAWLAFFLRLDPKTSFAETKARDALDHARAIVKPYDRAAGLLGIASKSGDYHRARALREGYELALNMEVPKLREQLVFLVRDLLDRMWRHKHIVGESPDLLFLTAGGRHLLGREDDPLLCATAKIRGWLLNRAARLFDDDTLRTALGVAFRLENPLAVSIAVRGLFAYLNPEDRGNTLDQAFGLIDATEKERDQADLLCSFASLFPQERRADLYRVANALHPGRYRDRALSKLHELEHQPGLTKDAWQYLLHQESGPVDPLLRRPGFDAKVLMRPEELIARFPVVSAEGRELRGSMIDVGDDPLNEAVGRLLARAEGRLQPTSRGPARASTSGSEADSPTVSTGVSTHSDLTTLGDDSALAPETDYVLWLQIGEPAEGALERAVLPVELLPPDARLDVIVFSNSSRIRAPKRNRAVFVLDDGAASVVERAYEPPQVKEEVLRRRVFFLFRTPKQPGEYSLRLCLYCKNVLVQARRVGFRVRPEGEDDGTCGDLEVSLDYCLSASLSRRHLDVLAPQTLTIMVNAADDGSHHFHFSGQNGFSGTVSRNPTQVANHADDLRSKFRLASWGSEKEWDRNKYPAHRYRPPRTFKQLKRVLVPMAKAGYAVYDVIASKLENKRGELESIMRAPGIIQFAHKDSLQSFLPIGALYDHPLDEGVSDNEEFRLCPRFLEDSSRAAPLWESRCFKGECPDRLNGLTVCPSGFWGFRHAIGMPLSTTVGGKPFDSPVILDHPEQPRIVAGVCTDPQFRMREGHLAAVRKLVRHDDYQEGRTRADMIKLLTSEAATIVYFYCHGGRDGRHAFLQIGDLKGKRFLRSTLRTKSIEWDYPGPLIFVNGCHTSALGPENAYDLVSGFLSAKASGFVGTEITVFEPLATSFARLLLYYFLRCRLSYGDSARRARLELLRTELNPLGLVYVGLTMPGLRLAGDESHGTSRAG